MAMLVVPTTLIVPSFWSVWMPAKPGEVSPVKVQLVVTDDRTRLFVSLTKSLVDQRQGAGSELPKSSFRIQVGVPLPVAWSSEGGIVRTLVLGRPIPPGLGL